MFGTKDADRWTDVVLNAVVSGDDVYHIDGHEVKSVTYKEALPHGTYKSAKWVCWRCEKEFDYRTKFTDTDCHDCNCDFCPKEIK